MNEVKYINYIHSHSDYSNIKGFLDCTIKVKDSARYVFKKGSTAVFLTDHESLSGHAELWEEVEKMRKKGKELYQLNPTEENYRMMNFKAVLGNEIYITKEGLTAGTWKAGDKFYHLILLAKDRVGWEQLNELSTRAWSRMFKRGAVRTPTYLSDLKEVIGRNPGHLICTTACLGNILGEKIELFHRKKDEETKQYIINYILFMKSIFGEDFYLEIQPNKGSTEQINYNAWLKEFSILTKTPLVVSTDNHYFEEKDRLVHKAYLNSDDSQGEREIDTFYATTYFLSPQEIKTHLLASPNYTLEDIEKAMKATHEIANKCKYYEISSSISVPAIESRKKNWEKNIYEFDFIPMFKKFSHSEYEIDRYFIYKIIHKYKKKLERGLVENSTEEHERMNLELDTYWQVSEKIGQRMSNYFNTMEEILEKIWEISVVGAGRGSAGASFINFILDITQANPLKIFDRNYFYRFAHPTRLELADIDVDSSSSKKEEIFQLLSDWFAEQGKIVSKVATFGTEKSKSALITAARGLGYEPEEGLFLASLVPVDRGSPRKLSVCMYGDENHKPVGEFVKVMEEYSDVFEVAIGIEGLIRSLSQHAAAIVIIEKNELHSRTSLVYSPKGGLTTAYNLEYLEKYIGLVKYDLLQTDAVDAIQTTLFLLAEHGYINWEGSLKATYDKYLHPSVINYIDGEMWQKAQNNKVISLFQWDSPQGRQGMEVAKPQTLREMSAVNSALRLMTNEYHTELPLITYAKQKENIQLWYSSMKNYGLTEEEIKILEKHLLPTYGLCIEQESAMEIAMDSKIANFSMKDANYLRKTIARKKMEEVEKLQEYFYTQGEKIGTRKQLLEYIWNEAFGLQMAYALN